MEQFTKLPSEIKDIPLIILPGVIFITFFRLISKVNWKLNDWETYVLALPLSVALSIFIGHFFGWKFGAGAEYPTFLKIVGTSATLGAFTGGLVFYIKGFYTSRLLQAQKVESLDILEFMKFAESLEYPYVVVKTKDNLIYEGLLVSYSTFTEDILLMPSFSIKIDEGKTKKKIEKYLGLISNKLDVKKSKKRWARCIFQKLKRRSNKPDLKNLRKLILKKEIKLMIHEPLKCEEPGGKKDFSDYTRLLLRQNDIENVAYYKDKNKLIELI